jgi:hypothetical protein
MDEDEVIFIDDDERNAFTRRRRPSRVGRRPGGRSIVVPASRRPTVIRHTGGDRGEVIERRPTQVVVQPNRPVLGGFSTGELIEMASQIIAAIQPLPGAPTAQGQCDVDVENLVLYQTALAAHAKRDEQLRTLGNLVGRLLQ